MNDLAPLSRPVQSQVKIDPTAKDCPSDGFNYPTFRQLNKHARIYLSKPLELSPSAFYNLFDVANSKGWFVAVKQSPSGSDLIFSTLGDLRSSFSSAKDSPEELFTPKRMVSTLCRANIVRFAAQDSRLVVAQDNGSLLLFDTSQLFTEGANEVHPLTSTHIQTTYLRQIVPNPGTEPGLSGLIAVVSNGKVQLLDTQLEPQGGWTATDLMTQPIAVSWSPKGKHIAIGLQTGDILTYSLTNKTNPHKHIPPTVDGILASLNWLGPGHTFRTSYAAQGDTSPKQHIIVLDTKTSTATYFAPDHPFPISERNFQNACTLSISKWDADSASNDENKSLTIVGDASSIDLEVLGSVGNSWYRQSQENPLSLPLDSAMDDTIILALEGDLTDSTAAAPIMYAYLNDGSLQGWHLEHSKPYLGIVTPTASGLPSSAGQISVQAQYSGKDSDMGAEQTPAPNAFAQQSTTTSTFGQSSFSQQSPSAFGSQQTTSAFGQTGFGQKSPQATSAFGQPSFGQPSAFGVASGFGSASAFGQLNQTSTSAFGSVKPATGFGAFGGSNNAFGSSTLGPFGSAATSAFGNLNSGTTNAFGQGSFGSSTQSTNETPSSSDSPTMTREASMSDSTPSLGGFGLGSATPSDPNARNSMFGSFSPTPSIPTTNEQSSTFGSGPLVKPATGFGAFSTYKPSTTFEAPKPAAPTTAAFGASSQPATTSGFGQSGFANPAFGKSAFGQPAFGKPSLGAPSTITTSTASGGFSAFANTTSAFGSTAPTATTTPSSGGFSAFVSSAPTAFGTALESAATSESKPATVGGFSAFASSSPSPFGSKSVTESKPPSSEGAFRSFASGNTPSAFGSSSEPPKESPKPASAFAGSTTTTSAFAAPSIPVADVTPRAPVFGTSKPAFDNPSSTSASTSIFATPSRPSPFANVDDGSPEHASPPSSPEPFKSPPASASSAASFTPNAFSNLQTTPSSFKPASGFGAFGNSGGPNTDSPFFKKATQTQPSTSIFALGISPKTPTNTAAAPTFGSTSALGAVRSAFAPITPSAATPTKVPATSAFSAFSGASSSFSSYVGKKTSFADLLKTGDDETTDPEKAPMLPLASSANEQKPPPERISVFGTSTTSPKKGAVSAFAPIAKDGEKEADKKKPVSDEPSYGSISSSTSSSFIEVTAEGKEEGEYEEDAEHSGDEDDANSFLSDILSDSYHTESGEEGSDKEENELPDGEGEESHETLIAPSRSPSPTPQPETPLIKVSQSIDEDEEHPAESPPQEREQSTTPPGTPVKEPISPFTPSPATPVANASFGLGLGRPSTKPTRSSPLAKAISGSDEEEEEEEKPIAPIPVSPKAPVEVLPVKLEEDTKDEASLKRPKTPPLLSVFGGKSPTPITPSLSPATSVFKAPPPPSTSSSSSVKAEVPASGGQGGLTAASTSIFGKPQDKTSIPPQSAFGRPATVPPNPPSIAPSLAIGTSTSSVFGNSVFSPKPVPSAPFGAPGISGIKSPTVPPLPTQGIFGGFPSPSPAQQSTSMFGMFGAPKPEPKTPGSSMFGGSFATPKSSPLSGLNAGSPSTPPKAQSASSPPTSGSSPKSTLEEGMQKECMRLVISMQSDFVQVAHVAQVVVKAKAEISNQIGGSSLKADLGDIIKWTLNDLEQFKNVLKQYEADLDHFEANKEKDQQTLREIQSNMLKAGTRREEIMRFNKAKDDKEFAKMLKLRTLGPEYIETQTQLRKSIKNIRDSIQKLETRLEEDKKKLAESTSYKPSFRAPSLDTINRTYRNIEIAIDQQSTEVARLASRLGKFDIKEAITSPQKRDSRLPDSGERRTYNTTPSVAAATAAALNSERSAARLKKALFSVRSEPLMNIKAVSAPSAPVAFTTPKKTPSLGLSFSGGGDESIPEWDIDLPPDNFDPSGNSSPSPTRHRGQTKAKKHTSFNFKRNSAPAVAPVAAEFDWGPLPSFSAPPPKPAFSFVPIVKK